MKPEIEKIKLTKEQQEEVNKILRGEPVQTVYHYRTSRGLTEHVKTRKLAPMVAKKRMVELLGGICPSCGKWPDYRFIFDVGDGAKRIERYCSPCLKQRGFKL